MFGDRQFQGVFSKLYLASSLLAAGLLLAEQSAPVASISAAELPHDKAVAALNSGGSPVFSSQRLICQLMQIEQESLPALSPSAQDTGNNLKSLKRQEKDAPPVAATPCLTWIDPLAKLKGVLLCVHGLGLHKGTYQQLGERMAPLGWGVYAVDVRGFGTFMEMPGERRVDFPGCLEDVRQALLFVHKTHPGVPVFLLGESMGGAIALRVTAMHPELVDGLISSVPGGDRFHQAGDAVKVGMKLLTGPNKTMDVTDIVVNRSTNKEELRQAWLKDPLARFSLTPVELIQFQHFMDDNSHWAKKITQTPVLMLQGDKDQLVKKQSNESIVNEIPSKDSVLVFVDTGEHLIVEEGQFTGYVIDTLCGWLNDHTSAAVQSPRQGVDSASN